MYYNDWNGGATPYVKSTNTATSTTSKCTQWHQCHYTTPMSQSTSWVHTPAPGLLTDRLGFGWLEFKRQGHTHPGTIIHTDQGSRLSASHGTVDHSAEFVDLTTGVHTQNIESLWCRVKKKLKAGHADELSGYLDEFMWSWCHTKTNLQLHFAWYSQPIFLTITVYSSNRTQAST